jgi:NADH:ubiquinone oxidoreductase subunit 6 (subunit J)
MASMAWKTSVGTSVGSVKSSSVPGVGLALVLAFVIVPVAGVVDARFLATAEDLLFAGAVVARFLSAAGVLRFAGDADARF